MSYSMEEVREARSRFERDFDSVPGIDTEQKEAYVQRHLVEAGYANMINAHDDPVMCTNGCEPDSLTHALGLAEDADARFFADEANSGKAQTPETPLTVRPMERSPYFVR